MVDPHGIDEKRLRNLEDNMLLMQKDVHLMSQSMQKMAESMEKLAEISNRQVVLEERCELRHVEMKSAVKKLHERVDTVQHGLAQLQTKEVDKEEAVKFVKDFQGLLWDVAKYATVGALGLVAGAVIYVIKVGGIQ